MKFRSLAALLAVSIAALGALSTPAAAEGRFFFRAGAGASFPTLDNLQRELERQPGGESVDPGLSLGVSLGRSFAENAWSLELCLAASFYPEFIYDNDYEGFAGKLRRFDFFGILRRHWRTEAKWFRPSLGIGAGYGTTELVSGGGKMGAVQGLGALRLESALTERLLLAVEGIYTAGLESGAFTGPFLENVDTDAVYTSDNVPLEDTFSAYEIRLGITVWLPKRTNL